MCSVPLTGARANAGVMVPLWQAAFALQLRACYEWQEFHVPITLLLPFLVNEPGNNATHDAEYQQQKQDRAEPSVKHGFTRPGSK